MTGRSGRPWVWIYSGTAVVMLIATGIFTWQALDSRREPGTRVVAGAPPREHIKSSPERYRLLARFEPPPVPDYPQADAEAFRLYSRHDYRAAIRHFRAQPGSVEARFYAAACDILLGNADSGMTELRHIVAAGNTPYLEPARFYLAKALLAEGDIGGARKELSETISLHGDMEKQAQVLLAELQ